VNITDAEVIFPTVFVAVPFLTFIFGTLLVCIVLIIVLHIIGQHITVHLENSFRNDYSVYFFSVVNQVVARLCCGNCKAGNKQHYYREHSFQKNNFLHDISILDCYFHIVFKSGANVQKEIEIPNKPAIKR